MNTIDIVTALMVFSKEDTHSIKIAQIIGAAIYDRKEK